jgi:hypothetical protein
VKNIRSRLSLGIAVAAFAIAIACAPSVTLTPLGTQQVYQATPDSVAIPLYATTKPECPYDEIAAITAEGTINRSVEAEVLSALIAKARAVGAHAIIGYTQSSRAASGLSSTSDVHVRSGTAIRFRSADCMK